MCTGGVLALAAVAFGCAPEAPPVPSGPPDVVLLVIDTQRADRLSTYGYARPTSPELDALAASGTLFTDATAQSSWTQPSVASFMTGRYLSRQITAPERDAPTLAEIFADAGYRTVGLSANVLLAEGTGFDRGFDHFDGTPQTRTPAGVVVPPNAEQLVERTLAALDASADGPERQPLFLYVQFFDPHATYEPHTDLNDVLPVNDPALLGDLDWQREQYPLDEIGDRPAHAEPWVQLLRSRALYDQEVRHTDRWVRRFLDALEERGIGEGAVFALTSDHGEGLWDHVTPGADEDAQPPRPDEFFYQEHGGTMYQSAVHVPLMLWGRGVPAGERVERPVELIDLAPTLLELAGIERPRGLDGDDLIAPKMERGFVHSVALGRAMVREIATGLTLIVVDAERRGGGIELFDLVADPDQRIDLASRRPDDVARLREELERWIEANPTEITSTRKLTPQERKRLEDLGYGELQIDDGGE